MNFGASLMVPSGSMFVTNSYFHEIGYNDDLYSLQDQLDIRDVNTEASMLLLWTCNNGLFLFELKFPRTNVKGWKQSTPTILSGFSLVWFNMWFSTKAHCATVRG